MVRHETRSEKAVFNAQRVDAFPDRLVAPSAAGAHQGVRQPVFLDQACKRVKENPGILPFGKAADVQDIRTGDSVPFGGGHVSRRDDPKNRREPVRTDGNSRRIHLEAFDEETRARFGDRHNSIHAPCIERNDQVLVGQLDLSVLLGHEELLGAVNGGHLPARNAPDRGVDREGFVMHDVELFPSKHRRGSERVAGNDELPHPPVNPVLARTIVHKGELEPAVVQIQSCVEDLVQMVTGA